VCPRGIHRWLSEREVLEDVGHFTLHRLRFLGVIA
jgi:hypothetical protein